MAFGISSYLLILLIPFLLLMKQSMMKLLRSLLDYCHRYRDLNTDFPPGSRGILLPFLGETLQFLAAIYNKHGFYSFVQVRHLWYGNCFKTHIFGETYVFVSSTESAKEILTNDLGKFTKRYIRSIGELVGAESLLCASHQSHKLIRGRLLELFSSSSIAEFIKQFDQLVVSSLAGWKQKRRVVILDEALEMTSKAMCKMLLSLDDESQLEMLQKDVACVCQAMLSFPLKLPWTRFSKGLKARKRIMDMLDKMIEDRRGGDPTQANSHIRDHNDFLQHLLLARYSNLSSLDQGATLTNIQIKDNILTMIIAGQDTTASAITWMVKYLDENPRVVEALRDELQSLEKKVRDRPFLKLEELSEMSYAAKVVKESLRMASVVPWFPRVALHDCKIQGKDGTSTWMLNLYILIPHCTMILTSSVLAGSKMKQNRTAS